MKVTILGTGASQGVPIPLCSCPTCLSTDPRDKRLRSSVYIEVNGISILIDTSIDFRVQALTHQIKKIDALLITHHHFDHLFGIDDVRSYSSEEKKTIPLYASQETSDEIFSRFAYAFQPNNLSLGIISLSMNIIDKKFTIEKNGNRVEIEPIEVTHGRITIFGFRIGNFAYITDCKTIPPASLAQLQNLHTLIISGLKYTPHPSHTTIGESVEYIQQINPKQAFLTHLHHSVKHSILERELPPNICPSYDGLTLDVPDAS